MNVLNQVPLSSVIFTQKGVCRYSKFAINLLLKSPDIIDSKPLGVERAYLEGTGGLIIRVTSLDGKELINFKFESNEFRIALVH